MRELKRFIAACFAMNGILSSGSSIDGDNKIYPNVTASVAFKFADELIKQENL